MINRTLGLPLGSGLCSFFGKNVASWLRRKRRFPLGDLLQQFLGDRRLLPAQIGCFQGVIHQMVQFGMARIVVGETFPILIYDGVRDPMMGATFWNRPGRVELPEKRPIAGFISLAQ